MSDDLTDEQVANWRAVLAVLLGPVVFLMTSKQIKRLVVIFQECVDEESKPCQCDPTRNGTTTHRDGRVTCNKCQKERKP